MYETKTSTFWIVRRPHRFHARLNTRTVALYADEDRSLKIRTVSKLFAGFRNLKRGDRVLIETRSGLRVLAFAFGALLKGAVFEVLVSGAGADVPKPQAKSGAPLFLENGWYFCDRWLYKHASRVITTDIETQAQMAAEMSDLEISIALMPNSNPRQASTDIVSTVGKKG